jgi:hypothetical protein
VGTHWRSFPESYGFPKYRLQATDDDHQIDPFIAELGLEHPPLWASDVDAVLTNVSHSNEVNVFHVLDEILTLARMLSQELPVLANPISSSDAKEE